MKPAAQPISNQRLDRALRWSRLWLLRIASWILQTASLFAPLERSVEAALTPRLNILAEIILRSIALKARWRVAMPASRQVYGPRGRLPHLTRSVFGSRLRKLSRAKTCGEKIAALLALLDSAEAEIGRLAKRLRGGLTRRRGGVQRETAAYFAPDLFCVPASGADTS